MPSPAIAGNLIKFRVKRRLIPLLYRNVVIMSTFLGLELPCPAWAKQRKLHANIQDAMDGERQKPTFYFCLS